MLGFWITGKMLDPRTAPFWRRRLWLTISVLFFGQLLLGLAISLVFLMTGKLHFSVHMMIEGGVVYRGALMPGRRSAATCVIWGMVLTLCCTISR